MLLHIGNDVIVPLDGLICILNDTGLTPETAGYLARARKQRRFHKCVGQARSYVLVNERGREAVYASPISAATLEKRLRAEAHRDWLRECAVLTIME